MQFTIPGEDYALFCSLRPRQRAFVSNILEAISIIDSAEPGALSATVRELAEKLGVSIATLSRYRHNHQAKGWTSLINPPLAKS